MIWHNLFEASRLPKARAKVELFRFWEIWSRCAS